MCTVTYVPTRTGKLITSNRDEHDGRGRAALPITETVGSAKITYPKDPKSGGTWIAIKNTGEVAVLLNGAFQNHQKLDSYRESRGKIFLKIIRSASPLLYFKQMELMGIENFTLILSQKNKLTECRWDGMQKHIAQKDHHKPHIWSSVTLYAEPIRAQRIKWFGSWLASAQEIDQQKIIQFHRFGGNGNTSNNLVMLRNNGISTMSITSSFISNSHINIRHEDLKNGALKEINQRIVEGKKPNPILERITLKLRIMAVQIFSWEYWPMHVVYAPMYLYWFYLSARARSFFFFSAANPSRKNAGFAMENKSDSYQYLPQQYYPVTLVCPNGISATELKVNLDSKRISFPLIAKPEMGERGIGVKLINNLAELVDYSNLIKSDFLVQQFINYPHEIGIFYCRLPGHASGKITGMVGKQLLSVKGDGKSTLKVLLMKNDRHLLQLRTLQQELGNSLEDVLAHNEERLVVPYGNHCKGAMFSDLSYLITEKLVTVIDNLCKQLPAFYFGRLDVKFASWEELENGANFSVIEINGAASEPTHIYDPKHSIFFAWREIKKHWDLLYHISTTNAKTKKLSLMGTVTGIKMLREHALHIKKLGKIS